MRLRIRRFLTVPKDESALLLSATLTRDVGSTDRLHRLSPFSHGRAACQVRPFLIVRPPGVPGSFPSVLWPRLTSRHSPRPLLVGALRCCHRRTCPRSPQVRTQSSPALPPHLPLRLNQWVSLCCASSPRRIGLLCASCSSAHGFRLAFLPTVGRPSAVGLS
jgi:hypothetical protein